jgi:hypothetical protein
VTESAFHTLHSGRQCYTKRLWIETDQLENG